MERTLILFKPDCVQRRLVGRIMSRFEDKGLNVVAMKLMQITPDLAKKHYAEHVQKGWYPTLEAVHHRRPGRGGRARRLGSDPRRSRNARRDERPEGRRPARSAATSAAAAR